MPTSHSTYIWIRAAAGWFAVAALLGTILRASLATGIELPLPFLHILHAHSHIALFGWLSTALIGLLYGILPQLSGQPAGNIRHQQWHYHITQIATAGALIAFLWQGYGTFSIVFSTVHLFLWYYFALAIRRHLTAAIVGTPALYLIRLSIAGLLVSSLGTWSLPFTITLSSADATLYKNLSVDFFLHTFADGWLIPATFGVLVAARKLQLPDERALRQLRINLWLYLPADILSSLRPTANQVADWLPAPAIAGGAVLGILYLHLLWLFRKELKRPYLWIPALFLFIKAYMEMVPLILTGPELWSARPALIAYLHITMLGVATLSMLAVPGIVSDTQRSIYALFVVGIAALIASLLLLSLPIIPALYDLVPEAIADWLPTAAQYGALAASIVLLIAGLLLAGSLFAQRKQHSFVPLSSGRP